MIGDNPVEAEKDPALGSRAAQSDGQLCAERSGTKFLKLFVNSYLKFVCLTIVPDAHLVFLF